MRPAPVTKTSHTASSTTYTSSTTHSSTTAPGHPESHQDPPPTAPLTHPHQRPTRSPPPSSRSRRSSRRSRRLADDPEPPPRRHQQFREPLDSDPRLTTPKPVALHHLVSPITSPAHPRRPREQPDRPPVKIRRRSRHRPPITLRPRLPDHHDSNPLWNTSPYTSDHDEFW